MVLWKVVDKLCNPSVCGSHFIFHDLLVDVELYCIISLISYFLVHDSPQLDYELVGSHISTFCLVDIFLRV